MPLTHSFKDLVQSRVERDPAFGGVLLWESVDVMMSGDVGERTSVKSFDEAEKL